MKEIKDEVLVIQGSGGGSSKKQHTPVEEPNTLRAKVRGKILDLIAYGPIKGLANGLKSVYLEGTPVENADGTKNFEGITITTREGYPDQSRIPGFKEVENTIEVNTEIKHANPVIRSITNNDADAASITIQLASLYQRKENGDTTQASVRVLADVRKDGGAWVPALDYTFQGKTTSPYPKTFRIDLKPYGSGSFDIRVRRDTPESEESTLADKMTWTLLSEIIDRRFSHPNMALVGIEVDSELFGSQMPARVYDMFLSITKVPSNWDPETRAYTGIWDGTFKDAWHDNPAWAYYDLAMHPVIGAGLDVVDKWELYRIARYCDELVPNGYGGMEPRFTINTVFSDQEDATAALNTLASAFRGMTYWGTNTVVPVADMPEEPVLTVGPSSVKDGDFSRVGTSIRERHSVAIVMWNDPEDMGKAVPEIYEDPESIAEFGWRETRVTAVGCNSRGQARRLAMWILDSERNETQTLSYAGTSEHAFLRPGNIIEVADPYEQGARMSGRLLERTTNRVVLDQVPAEAVAQVGGTWYLSVMLPDLTMSRHRVSSFAGNIVHLVDPLLTLPLVGAIWGLYSAGLQLPQYRVITNQEDTKTGMFNVTATEYDPNKYSRVELGLILPDRPTSLIPTGALPAPSNLTFQVYTYYAGTARQQGLLISYEPPNDVRVESFVIDVKGPSDASYRTVYNGRGTSFDLADVEAGQWSVRVRSVASTGRLSMWIARTVQITQLLLPAPPDSVHVAVSTFAVTLTPISAYPDSLWEFWRSTAALTAEQIEANAQQLPTGTYLADTGLKPDTQYYYYVRGVNQYGKSTWFGVQAKTENNFDEIIDAVTKEAMDGDLGQWFQGKLDETLQGAIDNAEQQVQGAIDHANTQVDAARAHADQLATSAVTESKAYADTQVAGAKSYADTQVAGAKAYADTLSQQTAGTVTALSNTVTGLSNTVNGINATVSQLRTDLNSTTSTISGQITGLQGQLTALGAAGAYDKTVAYIENDVTRQGNRIYRAISAVPAKADGSNGPPNATYWKDIGQTIKTADATATAVSDMQTTIGTINGTLTSQAGLLTGLRNDVDGKASTTALNSLSGRVTSAENTITSQGQSITAINNSLTATNGNVTALQGSFTSLSGTVTSINGAVTGIGQAVTSIGTTLGNMGGNGTNLLPLEYTSFGAAAPVMHKQGGVSVTTEANATAVGRYLLKIASTTSQANYFYLATSAADWTMKIKPGKAYILSFWVQGDAARTMSIRIRYRTASSPFSIETVLGTLPVTTTLTRVSLLMTMPVALVDDAHIVMYQNNTAGTGTNWYDGFMFEEQIGNGILPSAFTPGYAARQTTAMAEATTALTGRVSAAEGAITSQSESITSLSNSMTLVGSENLVFNPSFEKATDNALVGDGWWYDVANAGQGRVPSLVPSTLAAGVAQRADLTGLSASLWFRFYTKADRRIKLVPGTQYTVSINMRGTVGLNMRPQVYGINAAGSSSENWVPSFTTATGAWQRLTYTFTPGATTDVVYIAAVVYGSASLSAGFIEVDRVQLEEGGIATGWRDNGQAMARDVEVTSTALGTLTSTVNQIGGTVTSQSQSITQLSNSLSSAGGENLLFNPSFDRGSATQAERWRVSVTSGVVSTASLVASTLDPAGKAQRFDMSGLVAGSTSVYVDLAPAAGDRPPTYPGQVYTASVFVRGTPGLQAQIYIQFKNAAGTGVLTAPVVNVTLTNTWQRITSTSPAAPSNAVTVDAIYRIRSAPDSPLTAGFVEWDRAQLEQGDSMTGWRDNTKALAADASANATVVQALSSKVLEHDNTLLSQSQSITSLTNTINHPTTGLATKASAAALTALTNTVTQQGDALSSAGQSITSLTNTLSRAIDNSPTKVYQSVFSAMSADQWVSTNSGNTASSYFSNVEGNTSGATLTLIGGSGNRNWWGASTRKIRFNPDVLYKLSVRVQQVAIGLSDPKFYAGLDAYAEDGVTRINVTGGNTVGSSHYPLASGVTLPVSVWTTFSVYVKGHTVGSEGGNSGAGTIADPKRMKTGTAWISPLLLAGHDNRGGAVAIDYFLIEDATEQVQIDANATAVSALTSTVTQQGQSITSLSQNIVTLTNTLGEVGGENLFFNPTFNKGDASQPDGWQKEGAAAVVNSMVTSWLNTGERAYRVAVTGVTSGSPYHSLRNINAANTAARVTPGAVHTASVYARRMPEAAALQLRVWIQYQNEAGAAVASSASNPSTIDVAGGRFSHTSIAPADAVMAFVYFRVHGPTASASNGTIELARPQFEQAGQTSGWKDSGRVTASDVAAVSTAVDALTSTVSNQGGTITSQGSRLTSLENSVNNATTGLNSKASASSVTALTNRVTAAEGTLTSQSSDITQLKNSLSYAQPFVAGKTWEFTGSTQGWQAMDAAATFVAGSLFGTMYKPSNFQCNFTPSFPGAENPYLRIRLRRRNTSRTGAQLYWANEDGGLAEARRVAWTLSTSTTDWQDIEIDLSGHAGWNGKNIIAIRLDMTNSVDTTAEIDVAYISAGRRASAASAQALSSLTSEVSDTKTLVTSQGSRITSLENSVNSASTGLATKASAASVTALTNRVTAAEGSLTSQSGLLTSLQNSLSTSGGENLLYNPSFETPTPGLENYPEGWVQSNANAFPTITTVASTLDPGGKAVRAELTIASAAGYANLQPHNDFRPTLAAGQTVTLSVYVRGTPGLRSRLYIQFYNAAGTWLADAGNVTNELTGEWQRVSATNSTPAPANTAMARVLLRVVGPANGASTTGFIEWDRVQLELSDTMSGWSDNGKVLLNKTTATSTALDQLTSTVTSQGGTITSQGTRLTSLENAVNNVSTGLASKASASALTALTNRVTAAEGTLTSQGSSITSLSNTLASVNGAVNLVPAEYSSFGAKAPAMNLQNGLVATTEANASAIGNYLLKLQNTISTTVAYFYLATGSADWNMKLKPGKSYILSFWVQADAVRTMSLRIRYINSAGTTVEVELATLSTTTTLTRVSAVMTMPAALVDASCIVFYQNKTASLSTHLYDGFMLEEQIGSGTAPSTFNVGNSSRQFQVASAAIDAVDSKVEAANGSLTSQGSRITSLENSVNNATTGLASKASATALTSLTNRVTAAEGSLSSQSSAITALENSVNNTTTGLNSKASTSALNALTTRVTATETGMTAQSTLLTNLRADLNSTQGVNLLPDSYTWLTNIDPPFTQSGYSAYGTVVLAAAPSGYALQFTVTSATASNIILRSGTTDNMTLQAGTYIFSMYARVTNKTTNSLMPFLSGQATINGATQTINGTRSKYTVTIKVAAEGRYSLGFQTSGNSGATIQVDSLMFERQTGNSTSASAFISGQSTVRVAQVESSVTAAATSITSLTTRMGNNESTVSTIASSVGGMQGMWGVKVSVAANGKKYVAGMGVNVTTNNGVTQGEILFQAERLTLINVASGGMFSPFVITNNIVYIANAMIQDASIGTAKIADAAITAAKIGVAEVDTLRIRGNAVTVPVYVTSPGNVTGSGVNQWKNLVAVGVQMDDAGHIIANYNAYQGFGSGIRKYMFQMDINGIVLANGGGDWADGFPGLTGAIAVGPGYFVITVKWWGEDSGVGVSQHTLYALGAKR